MAGGYPNLFPAGFIEFEDSCAGPLLYRNQPSRSNPSQAPTLNEFLNKYSDDKIITDFDFLNTMTYLKYINKHWKQIPQKTRQELVQLLQNSNSPMGKDLSKPMNHYNNQTNVENFTDVELSRTGPNFAILISVMIVAIVLGYLICSVSN